MNCPDDQSTLVAESDGVEACLRCRGAAFTEAAFATKWPGIRALLQPEQDHDSGAWAHPRSCPHCQRVMEPLRIQQLLAWIESCPACGLLWVEQLDVPVLDGRVKAHARERKMAAVPVEDRVALASALVEVDQANRQALRRLGLIHRIFGGLKKLIWPF